MKRTAFSVVPAIILAVTIVAVSSFGLFPGAISTPPIFLLTINLIFITGTNGFVAVLFARSYLKERSSNLLALSCALFASSLTALLAGWASTFSANANVTIFNIGILLAALLQVLAALLTLTGNPTLSFVSKKGWLVTSYGILLAIMALITALTLDGLLPEFFTASGPTPIRELILGSAAAMFFCACILYIPNFRKSRSIVLLLYLLGLATISVGLFGSLFVTQFTGLLSWLARLGQYVGGLYFLAAIVFLMRSKDVELNFSERWIEAFRNDSRQLETFFSNMLTGMAYHRIIIDKNGKPVDYVFLAVNDRFEEMTGLKSEKVLGKKATEVLPGIINEPVDWIGIYGKVALTGEPVAFEDYSTTLQRWYSVSAYSPRKSYFITIFEDISERKNALDEIVRLASFPTLNPNPIVEVDFQGRITYVNPAAKKQFPDIEALGSTHLFFSDWQNLLKTVEDKSFNNFSREVQVGDQWYGQVFSRVPNTQRIRIYSINISQRKKAEQEIKQLLVTVQQERDRLSSLVNSIPDEVWFTDINKKVTLANPSASKAFKLDMLGKTDIEEIASSFEVYRSDGSIRPPDEAPPLRALQGEKIVNEEEIVRIPASGFLRYRQVNAAPVRDGSSVIIGSVSIVRDITELKDLQRNLQRHTAELEKLVEERTKQLRDSERLAAIGATAGMVGHDIRNPLQAIISDVYLAKAELESIEDTEVKKGIRESLQEIETNTDYIDKIVQDLQDYARPLNPKFEKSDIESIVKKIIEKNGLPDNVEVSIIVEKPARYIFTDVFYLNRILQNLITNAVQAMPKGGKLSVASRKEGDKILITVEDSGVGIPKDIRNKMFTVMFTTKSKGQGFGLPVVKRMTESLGGKVSYESYEGKGTKFTVELPAKS